MSAELADEALVAAEGLEAPQRSSAALRLFEAAAALGVCAYLVSPWRTAPVDVAVLSLSCLTIYLLRGLVIPAPIPTRPARGWLLALGLGTVATVAGFWALGLGVRGHAWRWNVLIILAVYGPFAWIQQYATQRYLVQRICLPLAKSSEPGACLLAGLFFGLLHWPFPDLVLPTMLGGALWTLIYLRSGKIWPLALSHALTGTSLICGLYGRDPFASLFALVGA